MPTCSRSSPTRLMREPWGSTCSTGTCPPASTLGAATASSPTTRTTAPEGAASSRERQAALLLGSALAATAAFPAQALVLGRGPRVADRDAPLPEAVHGS